MVLRKIKTSDNNTKPYIDCSEIQNIFADSPVHIIILVDRKVHLKTRKHKILVTPDYWDFSDLPVRMHAHTSVVRRKPVMDGLYVIRRMSTIDLCVSACVVAQLRAGETKSTSLSAICKTWKAVTNTRMVMPAVYPHSTRQPIERF
jgi:hypothetical protein